MLTWAEKTGAYVLTTENDKAARRAGLTRSTRVHGSRGERVYFTAAPDNRTPTDNPYAALSFFREADADTGARLLPLWREYEDSWAASPTRFIDVPAPRGLEYLPFQIAGVEYALRRRHTIIGDQPGLGKTIQAIGVANVTGARRVLVVCPANVRPHWNREICRWSVLPRVSNYVIMKSRDGVNPYANYVIVSYDLMRHPQIHAALAALKFDLVVLDEGHYLKTVDALRTRAAFGFHGYHAPREEGKYVPGDHPLADRAERILALTGTPLPNRPRECYTLVRSMCWDAVDWSSYDDFLHRYNPSYRAENGHTVEAHGRLPELQARLRCNLLVRRMKADVLPYLPPKRYELTLVEESGDIRQVLRAESLLDVDPSDETFFETVRRDPELAGHIATLRREMGEAMVPRVQEHVDGLLDGGLDKVVVFAHHRSVIRALSEHWGNRCTVMWGGISAAQKQRALEAFIRVPEVEVIVLQLNVGGVGIDGLQETASHLVFAEASWTPGDNEQAIDRLHRIGQHSPVLAQFLVAPGSWSEKVLRRSLEKMGTIHETLDRRVL